MSAKMAKDLGMLFIPELSCILKIYEDEQGKYIFLPNSTKKEYLTPKTPDVKDTVKQLTSMLDEGECTDEERISIRRQLGQLETASAKGQTLLTQFKETSK